MKSGDWIRRKESDTKWHQVESIDQGDAITVCGKRMAPYILDGVGLEIREGYPFNRVCKVC